MNIHFPDRAKVQNKEPFRRFPILSTTSAAKWEQVLGDKFGVKELRVLDSSNVWMRSNFLRLNDLTLGYTAIGPRCTMTYEEGDYARFRLVSASSVETIAGSRRTISDAAHPTVVSPKEEFVSSYGDNMGLMFLLIRSSAMVQKLTTLTGISPKQRFVFDPTEFASRQLVSGLKSMIESFAQLADDPDALLSPIVVKELEQALIVQFLLSTKHNFSSHLNRDDNKFVPAHVRRAAEYIEASWNRPITIEDLVEVGGVSARTLFKAFAKTYGSGPMAFAKQQRLQHARRLLMRGDESVTGVAFNCGFSNLGHFAADYRKHFGELPSQTLSRRHP